MERSRRLSWLVSAILILWVGAGNARLESIDVLRPVVRLSPSMNSNEDFFGYAVALHQTQEPPVGDFNANVEATRIIVGAPKGTFPGGLNVGAPGSNSALRTGLVYQCPVSPSTCTGVFGTGTGTDKRLFDDEPNQNDEDKNEQFMGATLESNGNYFVACAPRWVSLDLALNSIDQGRPQGRCFISERSLMNFETLRPCRAGGSASGSLGDASCTTGIAAALYSDVRSRLPNGGLSCRLSSAADVVSTLSTFPPLPPSSMNVLVYRSSIISCFLFHRALL